MLGVEEPLSSVPSAQGPPKILHRPGTPNPPEHTARGFLLGCSFMMAFIEFSVPVP